jgi:hypothetical protein
VEKLILAGPFDGMFIRSMLLFILVSDKQLGKQCVLTANVLFVTIVSQFDACFLHVQFLPL